MQSRWLSIVIKPSIDCPITLAVLTCGSSKNGVKVNHACTPQNGSQCFYGTLNCCLFGSNEWSLHVDRN